MAKSINMEKFRYTNFVPDKDVKIETKPLYETRILADFQHYFPNCSTINSLPKLLRLVGSSKDVLVWYNKWNDVKTVDNLAPGWLDQTVDDQAAWTEALKSTVDLKNKEAGWNARIKKDSETLKNTVNSVSKERSDYIKTLPNMVIIDRVSVNELPMEKVLQLAVIEDDIIRKARGKELVLEYQKELYLAHKGNNFKNPFD